MYTTDSSARASWDALQSFYVCCGGTDVSQGYLLWKQVLDTSVPDSCCQRQLEGMSILIRAGTVHVVHHIL